MSNYRQEPFINLDGIQKIQQELGRELGRLFEGDWAKPYSKYNETGDWSPATDTIETDSEWHYLIDLPGVALGDIDVTVHRGQIVVKGNKHGAEVGDVISSERLHGRFERTIKLPDDCDESTLNASMKHVAIAARVTTDCVAIG